MDKIIIYSDGGSRGNPGPAAIGAYIESGPEKIKPPKFYSEYLGEATNNEAEYEAIIFAIKKIKHLAGREILKNIDVEIMCDSELIVNQLNHKYKIEEKKLQPLFLEIWNLMIDFGSIKFIHVQREQNKEADKLVNHKLNEMESRLSF